jgi:response regulator RpfG family c-di-GMP phosphodiesterase
MLNALIIYKNNKNCGRQRMRKEQEKLLQVMIIDNDKYIRESLSTFFDNGKLRLLIFKTALEGLNSLRYQDIDVIICDYFLPDTDGLSLLKQVGLQNPEIARVLMSTIVSDELRNDITIAGIDALLEKPLSVASIGQILCDINKKRSTYIKTGDKK